MASYSDWLTDFHEPLSAPWRCHASLKSVKHNHCVTEMALNFNSMLAHAWKFEDVWDYNMCLEVWRRGVLPYLCQVPWGGDKKNPCVSGLTVKRRHTCGWCQIMMLWMSPTRWVSHHCKLVFQFTPQQLLRKMCTLHSCSQLNGLVNLKVATLGRNGLV